MKLYDLIKKYGSGKGESTMWKSVKFLSDAIEPMKDAHPEKYWQIVKGTYASMNGKHFNEEFAEWQVEQMHFTDKNGNLHKAPYWSADKVKTIYEAHKSRIPDYNCWDFYVTMNMVKADNYCMLKMWFPNTNEDELDSKLAEMAINYLTDPDAPHLKTKIWSYFNE